MAYLSPPAPPTGMHEPQLYRWAQTLCDWMSTNGLQAIVPVVSTATPITARVEPRLWASVQMVSSKLAVVHTHLVDASTLVRRQERRPAFFFLLISSFLGNVGTTVPNSAAAWQAGVLITAYVAKACWLVLLQSTGNNLLSIRHSGAQRFVLHAGLHNGPAYPIASADFST